MNRFSAALAVVVLAAGPLAAAGAPKAAKAAPSGPYKTDDQRTIYVWGWKVGQNLAPVGFSAAELKAFNEGISAGATGKPSAVSVDTYLPKVGELQQSRVSAKQAAAAGENKKKGAEFAAEFSKKDGVRPIQGGGWYLSETEGKGAQPKAEDKVKVHYRGTLLDGSEFDSSYKRGEPAEFGLNQVIPCWTHGVAMMKVGGKAKLVCPSDVAYGDAGHPPVIPSGATLVFEVELLDIVK